MAHADASTPAAAPDRHLVDAVELADAHADVLLARGGQVLADVVGADRQLPVSAVGEHRQLHPLGTAVVEQGLDRGTYGASGIEHVIDDHDRTRGGVEVDMRGVHDGRLRPRGDVVAVEADVEVSERDLFLQEVVQQQLKTLSQDRSATVNANESDRRRRRVALVYLMRDTHQRPRTRPHQDDLLRLASFPSWPHRTGLKEQQGDCIKVWRRAPWAACSPEPAPRERRPPAHAYGAPTSGSAAAGPFSGKETSIVSKSRGASVAANTERASSRRSPPG